MNRYYVHHNGHCWFVKDAALFESQGGLTQGWGSEWRVIYADTIEHARDKAALEWGK